MNLNELAEKLGLKKDEYIELVELLVETSHTDIAKVESAIREQDSSEAAGALHSIKGAAGNLGLMEIYELAKKGEHAARNLDLQEIPDVVEELKAKLMDLSALSNQ